MFKVIPEGNFDQKFKVIPGGYFLKQVQSHSRRAYLAKSSKSFQTGIFAKRAKKFKVISDRDVGQKVQSHSKRGFSAKNSKSFLTGILCKKFKVIPDEDVL